MQVRKFWSKKNSVIFVWPGDEALELTYDGMRIVVPARDQVARTGGGSIYTHDAALRDGRTVPGTALVEDVTTATTEGGYKTVLNIDHVCRYLTRDREDLFKRGFNIVEDPSQIQEAMLLGLPLYRESQLQRARDILAREMQRQSGYKARGEVPPPSTSEHLIAWAMKLLREAGPQAQAHKLEDIEAVLKGQPAAPAAAAHIPVDTTNAIQREHVLDGAEAFEQCQELGINLNNGELRALLAGNVDSIQKVRVKIDAARHEAVLKEAAAAV